MKKTINERSKPILTTDFEKALECLRLYSLLLLDAEGNISDESSARLVAKRSFTPHCEIVTGVIKDYYGKQGFLKTNRELCNLTALATRLGKAFDEIPLDPAATRLEQICRIIKLLYIREVLQSLEKIPSLEQKNSLLKLNMLEKNTMFALDKLKAPENPATKSDKPEESKTCLPEGIRRIIQKFHAEDGKLMDTSLFDTFGDDTPSNSDSDEIANHPETAMEIEDQLNILFKMQVINFHDELLVAGKHDNINLRFFPEYHSGRIFREDNFKSCNLTFERASAYKG